MNLEKIKVPIWFWIVASVLLLWNVMGIMSFFMHTMISEEALQALPDDQRELYGKYPLWTTIAFAFAVFGGFLGNLALLLRRKCAKPLLIISLIAIIIQMYHNMFMVNSVEVYGPAAWVMPILVIIFAIFLVWLASYSMKKKWLN